MTIRLVPFAPAQLAALIESVAAFHALSDLSAADGLREFFVSGEISPAWLELLRASTHTDSWFHGFAVVEQDTSVAIGTAGFKGPPDQSGTVEIAYGIVPSREGRGYATEAANALIAFASSDERVRVIRAHTLPATNPSTRVLTKCGFQWLGEVIDPEDGPVWRWERVTNTA